MMREAPKIDSRSGQEIFLDVARTLKQRLGVDANGGDPMAEALLRVFGRYCELIIQRLNRVPEKNHLAFLDALNVSRIPPVPAHVPLTFNPVKKLPGTQFSIVVLAHTQVAAPPGEGETEPIVFETSRELALTDIQLQKVVALDPHADSYSDKSALATSGDGSGEFAFLAQTPVAHEFYVRHDQLFGSPDIAWLGLQLEIGASARSSQGPLTVEWRIPTPKDALILRPLKDSTSGLTHTGEITFANLPEWPMYNLFGRDGRWLACRLQHRLTGNDPLSGFPPVHSLMLAARWQMEESLIQAAFFNNLALDLSRDFFPFGERPRFNDVFYLSSDALAKPHTRVELKIALTNPASGRRSSPLPRTSQAGHPVVQWEYWDGKRWIKLSCHDSTEALTVDGQVSFTLPPNTQPTLVNGLEGSWIRARLVAGDYGEDDRLEFSAAGGYQRVPSTLAPPSIQSITVKSSLSIGPVQPDAIVTHNNFMLDDLERSVSFRPFRPAVEPYKVLYLGFKVADETSNALAQRAVDFYFHIREPSSHRAYLRDGNGQGLLKLTWQYWNGERWKDASVSDTTESLTVPGMVTVNAGEDIAPWRQTSLGHELYWLRILWIAGEFGCSPDLRRILLNTVPATHTVTLENELLGSSNGKPNQSFQTARQPVLRELQLEVREPDMPEVEEQKRIRKSEGDDAITMVSDSQGRIEQIWVRWHEVGDWLSSTHRDRHFVVNRETGDILFGDGTQGQIPPAGANNIRLRRYQTGGGAVGNKGPGTIVQLRTTIPYLDSANNLEAASGGQDIEDWDSLRERGSRWLRHRDRAVTAEDYEDLAKLASPVIAKAKCYSAKDFARDPSGKSLRPGVVSVVIVPCGVEARPVPDLSLLWRVRDFLNQRRVPDASLVVLAPEYVRICVEAVVVAEAAHAGASVVSRCQEKLKHYLHPVTGGDEDRGWEFGERPHESDLYSVLEAVQGLGYVRSLHFREEEDRPGLLKTKNFLISSGEHQIRLGS
jgi:Baseplate J-like protein